MSVATHTRVGFDLRGIAEALAPGEFRIDPFGIVSGYKAYLIYTALAARSDAKLASIGIARTDLPRVSMAAAEVLRAA